jgi:DNA-binding transcriptional MerR regulator
MKIGEFSEKFNISKETIRFYASKKLLSPVKNGSFFIYDENCERDIQTIIQLKDLNFSLDEIARYLSYKRLSSKKMIAMHREMMDLFTNKISEVRNEIQALKRAEEKLVQRFEEIKNFKIRQEVEIGVPFAFIPQLVCPDCDSQLQIQNGKIANNHIVSGNIECSCGYTATIKEGIIVFEGASFINLFEENPEWLDHEKMLPPDYLNASMSAVNWLSKQFLKENLENKIVFDYSTQSGVLTNFILEKALEHTTNFTFYALDHNFHLINQTKALFSLNPTRCKAVFMCGEPEKAPIKKTSCDYLMSCFGFQTNIIALSKDIFKTANDFLKPGGKWFETLFSAEKKSDIQHEFSDRSKYFVDAGLKKILSHTGEYHFHNAAKTMKKGELGYYIKEDAEVSFFSYIGIKS